MTTFSKKSFWWYSVPAKKKYSARRRTLVFSEKCGFIFGEKLLFYVYKGFSFFWRRRASPLFCIRKLWKTQVFNIFHIFSNRVCRIRNEPIFVENSALVENCVESLLKSWKNRWKSDKNSLPFSLIFLSCICLCLCICLCICLGIFVMFAMLCYKIRVIRSFKENFLNYFDFFCKNLLTNENFLL